MDLWGWLRSLGLERYEAAFRDNGVDCDVLRDLSDQDLKEMGVLLGHRRKLLRAIAALDGPLAPVSAPRPMHLPIAPAAILAAAAAGAAHEAQKAEDDSVSASPQSSPMSTRLRPAQMIGNQFLPGTEGPTFLLTASDRYDDNPQIIETRESLSADDYADHLLSRGWRNGLTMTIAGLALAGLGGVGAFAYRAALGGFPTFTPIIKAESAPNKSAPDRPSNFNQTPTATPGSGDEFVSRWPTDNQEAPKLGPMPLDQRAAPPSTQGAVAPIASEPAAPPRAVAPVALAAASVPPAAPAPTPPSSESKKSHSVANRSGGSRQTETSTAGAKSAGAKPLTAATPATGNQPLSLVPDAQGRAGALPPGRSHVPVDASSGTAASSGEGYAVQVASERSAADAEMIFRSLQAKFPNQLGGREPIVRLTDLGPEGIYFRAFIGPFVSQKEAARVCSTLKAAGESCLVEKN